MVMRIVLLFGLVLGASATANPVTQVVKLIKDLRGQIVADGKAEEVIYNKMACWCETTTQNKASEIETAQDDLSTLSQDINSNKGEIATLASTINDLMTDISKNEAKQYEETTKRERQNADYMQNKAELTNAIQALDKAVQMLAGIDHLAFIQGTFSSSQAATMVHARSAVMKALDRLPSDSVPVSHLIALEKVGTVFSASGGARYKPFEPTITSILKDLLESFRATQETETTNEADLQTSYEDMMSAKAKELATKKDMLKSKEDDKARETVDMTANEAQWQKTAAEMKAANTLFAGAKAACTAKADEYNARVEARNEELSGIDDALKTLTDDDNRAKIGAAAADGPGGLNFFQVAAKRSSSTHLLHAYHAISQAAKATKSLRLTKIAAKILARAKGDGADATDSSWMDEVEKSIKEILSELASEQTTDTETWDNCREWDHTLQLEIDNRTHIIKRYNLKLDKLESKVEEIVENIEKASKDVAEIEEMQAQITDERDEENSEHNREVSQDKAAIKILESAMKDLGKYAKNRGIDTGKLNEADGKLLQTSEANDHTSSIFLQYESQHHHATATQGSKHFLRRHVQAKEPEFEVTDNDMLATVEGHSFSGNDKRTGATKGIVGLLSVIVDDLKSDIAKSESIEAHALADFEDMMKSSTNEKDDLKSKISDYQDDKADKESQIDDNNSWKEQEEADLFTVSDEKHTMMGAGDEGKDISFPCSFMYDNYHIRRKRRESEAAGLREGLNFLHGMTN